MRRFQNEHLFLVSRCVHFNFMKQMFFQKEVFLIKFQKARAKSLISAFSKLVLSNYSAISHDPLDQSNPLNLF